MQGSSPKCRAAVPRLCLCPSSSVSARDRLWEIKANSLFKSLYNIKHKCFYNYCSLRVMGVTSIGAWDKIQNPVEGIKAITETKWPGDIWARWPVG